MVYTIGTGLIFNNTDLSLINTPYENYPSDGIINVWRPDHWATWMFNISKYQYFDGNNTGEIVYDYGGFQGARGCDDPWGTKLRCVVFPRLFLSNLILKRSLELYVVMDVVQSFSLKMYLMN